MRTAILHFAITRHAEAFAPAVHPVVQRLEALRPVAAHSPVTLLRISHRRDMRPQYTRNQATRPADPSRRSMNLVDLHLRNVNPVDPIRRTMYAAVERTPALASPRAPVA